MLCRIFSFITEVVLYSVLCLLIIIIKMWLSATKSRKIEYLESQVFFSCFFPVSAQQWSLPKHKQQQQQQVNIQTAAHSRLPYVNQYFNSISDSPSSHDRKEGSGWGRERGRNWLSEQKYFPPQFGQLVELFFKRQKLWFNLQYIQNDLLSKIILK